TTPSSTSSPEPRRRDSELKQSSVTRNLRVHARRSQAVPEARLVGRHHGALQVLLQRIENADAAKTGAGDQHAVSLARTGQPDLRIERLDLVLEAQALPHKVAGRQVAPFAAGVVAQVAGGFEAMVGVVADTGRNGLVVEPGWQDQERPLDLERPKRRLGVE